MIIFLRGKAATGKSMIADEINLRRKMPIIRKDDIFDSLLKNEVSIDIANSSSYDILVEILQKHIDAKSDAIVDIGLSHTPYFEIFLSKIQMLDTQVYYYLCDCSNHDLWRKRIEERFINPKPNQTFQTIEEAVDHYARYEISPLNSEVILDSARPFDEIIEQIMRMIFNS